MSDNNEVVFQETENEHTPPSVTQESTQSENTTVGTTESSESNTGQTDSGSEQNRTSNATQDFEYNTEPNKNPTYRVPLPSINLLDFNYKLNDFKKVDIKDPSEQMKEWGETVSGSIEHFTVGGLYQDRFYDSKSHFRQGIETKEGNLNSISSVKFKKTEGELKGEIALLKVSKMLGLGDVVNVPLPHSGIWVTIKPPTEKDLIDFYHSIFKEKIMLGRTTYGLTLTNFSVYINNKLFDFILKHIHSVNFNEISKEELKNYVLIHDFPVLAWGFACTMYPNGFDYKRACVNDIEACNFIAQATINLTKLLWVDNASLSEAQKVILSENRPNKLSLDSYRKYIAEHTRVSSTTFTTKNGIIFKLKVPTFNEYTSDGLAWINKINSSIEHIILEDTNEDDAKTEMLNQYVKSSILRQFNHFIDYIEVDENTITDRATINDVLEAFSSDDDLRSEITENIIKFKAETTIALVGIPEFKCPSCGKQQNLEPVNKNFVNVIPLDTMSLVFLVLTSKISKILEREV